MDINKMLVELSKKLPRFSDGRIDYTNSDTAIVLSCFMRYKNKILLMKRSNKVNFYQFKWGAVAGFVDEPKPIEQKALEEAQEETGLKKEDILYIRVAKPYKYKDTIIKKSIIVFPVLIELKRFPKINLDWEHTEYRWIKPEEILMYDTIANIDRSMRRALRK